MNRYAAVLFQQVLSVGVSFKIDLIANFVSSVDRLVTSTDGGLSSILHHYGFVHTRKLMMDSFSYYAAGCLIFAFFSVDYNCRGIWSKCCQGQCQCSWKCRVMSSKACNSECLMAALRLSCENVFAPKHNGICC